jgi:hypothetical protein
MKKKKSSLVACRASPPPAPSPSAIRSSQNRSFLVAAVIQEKDKELFLQVRRRRDKKASMLLLSSYFLCCLPKPRDSGSTLTSAADARCCWCPQRGRRPPRFPLLNGSNDGEVIPLSLQPCCLLCMVAADVDLVCALAKCNKLVRNSIRKSCQENFVKW